MKKMKISIASRLALQIARARERAHITQSRLAREIGTRQSVISRIEGADQNLTLNTLSRIAGALHNNLVLRLRPARARTKPCKAAAGG